MLRRKFFGLTWSGLIALVVPKWVRAQSPAYTHNDLPMLQELAAVVLPGALGRAKALEVASHFEKWIDEYRPGADAGYGYGHPRPRVLGPNPSAHYGEQLRQLSELAKANGGSFQTIDEKGKREIVATALQQAGVSSLPSRPSGQHIAADLMSFFYNSSVGEDFLYNAKIRREECRGLPSSGQRPAPVS